MAISAIPEKPVTKQVKPWPVEKVLYGVGKAVTWLPEKQEAWLLSTYEKYIYPRLSADQQKKAKALEPKIKKAAKVGGWIMTGGEVIIAGVIVKTLYDTVKKKMRKPLIAAIGSAPVADATLRKAEHALPGYLQDVLAEFGASMDASLPQEMTGEQREQVKAMMLHSFSQLVVQGVPQEVEDLLGQLRHAKAEEAMGLGLKALFAWNKYLEDQGKKPIDSRSVLGLALVFKNIGFKKLAELDTRKLAAIDANKVLPLLETLFAVIPGGVHLAESVRQSLKILDVFLQNPLPEGLPETDDPKEFRDFIMAVAAPFYQYIHDHAGVVPLVNAFETVEDQHSKLLDVFTEFVETFVPTLGGDEEKTKSAKLNMSLGGIILSVLKFPGIGELGIHLKE